MGLLWGLCSVIITSVAQLGLSFAMANLPPMTQWQTFIPVLFSSIPVRSCYSPV